MKVRNGFVSNSSSSSFMMYGTEIDKDEAIRLVGGVLKNEGDEDYDDYCRSEEIENIMYEALKDTDLHFVAPYEYDDVMIGRSWSSVKDDETGAQFKASIQAQITKVFGKAFPCRTMSGEYSC